MTGMDLGQPALQVHPPARPVQAVTQLVCDGQAQPARRDVGGKAGPARQPAADQAPGQEDCVELAHAVGVYIEGVGGHPPGEHLLVQPGPGQGDIRNP